LVQQHEHCTEQEGIGYGLRVSSVLGRNRNEVCLVGLRNRREEVMLGTERDRWGFYCVPTRDEADEEAREGAGVVPTMPFARHGSGRV